MNPFNVLAGTVLLIFGTYQLTRGLSKSLVNTGHGASVITSSLFVIGLALGAPQLIIGVHASQQEHQLLALGTSIGAMVFGIFGVIGISALRKSFSCGSKLAKYHLMACLTLSITVYAFTSDLALSRLEGFFLIAAAMLYWMLLAFFNPTESSTEDNQSKFVRLDTFLSALPHVRLVPTALGLGSLALGAILFVPAMEAASSTLGVSEFIIGASFVGLVCAMTLILFSQVLSTIGQHDYMLNILFCWCVFTIAIVGGLAASLSPEGVSITEMDRTFFIRAMLGASIVCIPLLFPGFRMSRWSGAFFTASGLAYILYPLVLAYSPESIDMFSKTVTYTFGFAVFIYGTVALRDLME